MASVFHYVYGLLFRPRPRLVVQTVTDEGVIQKADETVITAHPRTNTPMEAPEEENAEEGLKMYAKGGFHPVRLREVYHGKYEVLRKIGYGRYSTVWLVKNQETARYMAMKVLGAECYTSDQPIFEREILQHLRTANPDHFGYSFINHLVDDFEHEGPNGTHVCLVFELMGETLASYGTWFRDHMVPNSVMRGLATQLLIALLYAHENDVIHTDIKPDNIFVKFQDLSMIDDEYLTDTPEDVVSSEESYRIIKSWPLNGYYFRNQGDVLDCQVTLGDWGVASWADNHLTEFIQPLALRAPEVLIGAPWNTTTDLWNLGAVVLEVFRAVRMFSGEEEDGTYTVQHHLQEMVAFFGAFPSSFLARGNQELVGHLFSDDGAVKDARAFDLPPLMDDAWMGGPELLDPKDRENFVSFLNFMMKIDPSERPTIMDLLRHPWLNAITQDEDGKDEKDEKDEKGEPEADHDRDSPQEGDISESTREEASLS